MDKYLFNDSEEIISIVSIGVVLEPYNEWVVPYEMIHILVENEEIIQYIQEGRVKVGTEGSLIMNPVDGEAFFRTIVGEQAFVAAIPDHSYPLRFDNSMVTDQPTGYKAVTFFMNMLTMMRELYNSEESPIHVEDFTPILGESGWAEQHASCIDNLETIHGKMGWHTQEIYSYARQRPLELLIYYGYVNSFNSGSNQWDNELVAQDMAKFGLIILGQGVSDPSHPDYASACTVVNRVKVLNPLTKIFGYMSMTLGMEECVDIVESWCNMHVHGIFLDEAGYDYGSPETNGRDAQNEKIDMIHNMCESNICFVNAWNIDHIIGTVNDPNFENKKYNPEENESLLDQNDWYLLESFAVNTIAYAGNNGYATYADWSYRGVKAQAHRVNYGINIASVGIIDENYGGPQEASDFAFLSSMAWCWEANGTSSASYGASTAQVEYIEKPEVYGMGRWWNLNASIQQHGNMVYRYVDHGRFEFDFDSGNQYGQWQRY